MDSENPTRSASLSVHIPIAILSAAIAIYLSLQLRNTTKQSEIMRWQLANLDKQTENLKAAQKQYADTLSKSEDTLKQADQIQGQYVNLFNDLLDLAKDDKGAKEVVDKWGIKRAETSKPATPSAETKDK